MPKLELDYDSMREFTALNSPEVLDRLGHKLTPPDSDEAGDGGELERIVPGKRIPINQLDRTMPWDYYNDLENNCGPSCCSVTVMHVTGKRFWPDYIADWMAGGEDKRGYTLDTAQVQFLNAHGVRADETLADNLQQYQSVLREQVKHGRLSIILRHLDLDPKTPYAHFEVVYAVDEPEMEVGTIDPYGGKHRSWRWGDLWRHSLDGVIIRALEGAADGGRDDFPFKVLPESWSAYTKAAVNVRRGPTTKYGAVRVLPEGTNVVLKRYTDEGEAVPQSDPDKRWHHSPGRGGWIYDGGLHRWTRSERPD